MKYITLIIGLLVMGCGKQEQATTEKPVKELTAEEKVVGEYEMKEDGNTYRVVLLENGVIENYENGKKLENKSKWKIANNELEILDKDGYGIVIGLLSGGPVRLSWLGRGWKRSNPLTLTRAVFSINKDGSINIITYIDKDGEREDKPKEDQGSIKKIK